MAAQEADNSSCACVVAMTDLAGQLSFGEANGVSAGVGIGPASAAPAAVYSEW